MLRTAETEEGGRVSEDEQEEARHSLPPRAQAPSSFIRARATLSEEVCCATLISTGCQHRQVAAMTYLPPEANRFMFARARRAQRFPGAQRPGSSHRALWHDAVQRGTRSTAVPR